jgi:hypothetical protein
MKKLKVSPCRLLGRNDELRVTSCMLSWKMNIGQGTLINE